MLIDIDPVGVSVHANTIAPRMRIREFSVCAPSVIEYLNSIAPDKREIALAHALEVGITELLRRRAK